MKTKEELAIEYCEYTVSKMDDETIKKIAVINLLANIDQETDIATWEDYVAQMKGLFVIVYFMHLYYLIQKLLKLIFISLILKV